jgi:hypothetical protein
LGIRAFRYMGFSVEGLLGIGAFGYTGFSVLKPTPNGCVGISPVRVSPHTNAIVVVGELLMCTNNSS